MRQTPHCRRLALAACLALALPAAASALRLAFADGSQGPRQQVYVTVTAVDGAGRFLRMDPQGLFHPCVPADNTVPLGDRAWCDYAFPVPGALDLDPAQDLRGGRIYLSAGAPLWLR